MVNINGFPFQLQKAPLANELWDSSGDIHRLRFRQCNFADNSVGMLAFTGRHGNRFPYLHKEGHFRAAVTVSKERMVIMETGSVESVGHDFGDLLHHLRRYRKQLIVFNSKYTPRTREVWKLTITTVNVGNRVVGVVTPFINLLQPNEEFIKQRTNPPTRRRYTPNYCADWLGRLQMVVTSMRGCSMRPLNVILPKTNLLGGTIINL